MAANTSLILQVYFPIGQSLLESMPKELLSMVAEALAPVDALRHIQTKRRAAHKKGVSKLLPLCLVSKRLETVVRPIIFGNVVVCRSIELSLLLRALIENPGIGGYVNNLEFSTKFLRTDPGYEFLDLGILRGLHPDLDVILPEGPARMTSRQDSELRSTLYLMVLNRVPNVKKAVVNAPTWTVRGLTPRQLAAFGIASLVAHDGRAVSRASLNRPPKTLATLTIEGGTGYRGLEEGLPEQFSRLWSRNTAAESKLEKLVWLYDDTTWFASLPAQQWTADGLRGKLTSLTTLRLVGSACRFSDIATVCDSFPSLKTLAILSNYQNFSRNKCRSDRSDGLAPHVTRLCLTRSITKLQCLESLFLDLVTGPENTRLLGDCGGLDLSSLPRLTHVNISFRLIVANITYTRSKYDPSLFLPQSLERFSIGVRGYGSEAGSNLMELLEGLHAACKHGFPRLRRVEYRYATGSSGQTVNPRCICVCGRVTHEDYCTYERGSSLSCAYLPWLPTKRFQSLHEKFGQRGIRLSKRKTESYVVTGATNAVVP